MKTSFFALPDSNPPKQYNSRRTKEALNPTEDGEGPEVDAECHVDAEYARLRGLVIHLFFL